MTAEWQRLIVPIPEEAIGDRDPFWTISDFYDVIARTNFSFLQHAKVKPWSVVCYEQGRHPGFIHANADAVARYARLCHFKHRITDADLGISESLNSEVLADWPKLKSLRSRRRSQYL